MPGRAPRSAARRRSAPPRAMTAAASPSASAGARAGPRRASTGSGHPENGAGLMRRCERSARLVGDAGARGEALGIVAGGPAIRVPKRVLEPDADMAAAGQRRRQGGGLAAAEGADRPDGAFTQPMVFEAVEERIEVLRPA